VPTEKILKVLKTYTTYLPDATRLVPQDNKTAWISSSTRNVSRPVVMDDQIKTIKEICMTWL
jgi:hypothetical protein